MLSEDEEPHISTSLKLAGSLLAHFGPVNSCSEETVPYEQLSPNVSAPEIHNQGKEHGLPT